MKRLSILAAAALLAIGAHAQNAPQSNTVGQNGSLDQQIIGDTSTTADHTQSHATQIGNAANANGAQLSTVNDTRDQNTNNVQGGAASSTATGANQSVTAGRADVNVGPLTTGPSSASTGAIDNTSKVGDTTAKQGQGQLQSATGGAGGRGGAGTATALGGISGATAAGAGASAGAGAGSGNRMVQEGDTDRSRVQVWANPVSHGAGAAAVPSANLIQQKGQCGPRVRVISTQVVGIRFGFFGGQSEVNLGYTDKLGPYLNEDGTPGDLFIVDRTTGWLIGDQYDTIGGMQSVSSANSISLGAFSGGDAAQGGVASSGGMQTIGIKIIVGPCVMPVPKMAEAPRQAGTAPAPRADRN